MVNFYSYKILEFQKKIIPFVQVLVVIMSTFPLKAIFYYSSQMHQNIAIKTDA